MAGKPEQRDQPLAVITKSPYGRPFLAGMTTATALVFNRFGPVPGESAVSNHLLCIPIIIAAFADPQKWIVFAFATAGLYLLMVYGFSFANPEKTSSGRSEVLP